MLDIRKKIIDGIREKMDSSIDEIAKVIMDPLINNSKDNRIYM
jgi:hypothetical protein